ncbi:MAG: PAS domain-containing protein [Methanomicrobiales archaeon]
MQSEKYLQTLTLSIWVGSIVIDAKTHMIIYVNPAALELLGTVKDAVINQLYHNMNCSPKLGKCPITDLNQTVDDTERTLLTADGRESSIIKYVVPVMLRSKLCLFETFIDNSYRKQIELKLAASEEKYRALAENSADIHFFIDVSGIVIYISSQKTRYRSTPKEIMVKGIRQFIHPNDQL